MKNLSKQEMTSIRLRTRKLILSARESIPFPYNYEVTGSIKKGRNVSVVDGKYDIDIDITAKLSEKYSAQEVYDKFKNAFKNYIRVGEIIIKKNRVIRISKENDFYIDIAIIDKFVTPKKIIVKNNEGKYVWRSKK